MALEITDGNFEDLVLKSDKPVLVDFWATWCGPCRMLGPVIEEISKEYEGKVTVGKVDVDNNQDFAGKYGIRNIPTVLVFQNGEVVGRQVGVAPKKIRDPRGQRLEKALSNIVLLLNAFFIYSENVPYPFQVTLESAHLLLWRGL